MKCLAIIRDFILRMDQSLLYIRQTESETMYQSNYFAIEFLPMQAHAQHLQNKVPQKFAPTKDGTFNTDYFFPVFCRKWT